MEYKDYYQTLGLERSATEEEIKRAYKKLARKYHPDVSKEKDAEAKFKDIGEAYKVLKDPETRAAYDRMGANWQAGQDFKPPPGWDAGFEFSGGGDARDYGEFSEFFESLFGGRGRQRAASQGHTQGRGMQMQGQDHHAKVMIDIEDAYRGGQRAIVLQMPTLDAQGRVAMQSRMLNVTIPKGVREGQHLRLSGQGGPGFGGGRNGDLYLEIAFNPHALYRIEGRDVYLQLPVTPWEAALGAAVAVPTPEGDVQMTIPANSAAGRKLRLKGRGIPGNPAGDLYVVLNIALPPADTEQARDAYRAMQQAFDFHPRAGIEKH